MHLSSKQLLWLLFPFIISFLVYNFSVEIMNGARHIFPTHERYSNNDLNTKIESYLEIETKYILFKDIQKKVELRKENGKWMANNLFYKELDYVTSEQNKQTSVKIYSYKLQAIFPDDKTAIIDGLIVKKGSLIHNARVIKIEAAKVAIKTNKGLKWLILFQ